MSHPTLRVLVVDDDPSIRELLATLLGLEGCEVAMASDGAAALEAAASVPPDVVLLDATMPGVSGYEVCRRLKAREPAPRVVMVTGRSLAADEREGQVAGADAYLRKPFSPTELLEVLQVKAR